VLLGGDFLETQEVDKFYIDLLQKGEESFLEGKFDQAISQLKTSLFGLHADNNLKAKALIYLSLSNYYIRESGQSRDYLEQALNLVGTEGIPNIGINERTRGELSGIIAHFKLGQYSPGEQETIVVGKPLPYSRVSDDSGNEGGANTSPGLLEVLIERDPDNISQYYHLYELYLEERNARKARKTLEKLVKTHPDEIYAYYLLGRMHYYNEKYKEADKQFAEALKPRPYMSLSSELEEELKTFQILSVYNMGDKSRALDMMSVAVHMYTEAKIRALPITGADKVTLREIIREYMKR
jgi:tetratricopeptide (TPR) repeat protein